MRQLVWLFTGVMIICCFSSGIRYQPDPNSVYSQSPSLPLPVAQTGAHPRLLISDAYIENTLKPRVRDAENPELWAAYQTYLNSEQMADDLVLRPVEAVRSLALAWLLTDERRYRDLALDGMQTLANRIETSPVMGASGATWDMTFLESVAGLALAYDWMYAALTFDDRDLLADILLRAAARLQNPVTDAGLVWQPIPESDPPAYQFQPQRYESALWVWALTATGLTLEDEDVRAVNLIPYVREYWQTEILPVLSVLQDGVWPEGVYYSFGATRWHIQTALAWWTARGQNDFAGIDWWYDRLIYTLFVLYPENGIPDYPVVIGSGIPEAPEASWGRGSLALLQAIFPDTDYADYANWYLTYTFPPDWMLVEDILWRDLRNNGIAPDVFTWRTFGSNHVFMRGNWQTADGNIDRNTTAITYQSGNHLSDRQFFDQGSFTIWRAGDDLLVRGGVYVDEKSWHEANYYRRTTGGNTLRICNLTENFDGIISYTDTPADTWLNDCGQRATLTTITPENWFSDTAGILETGDILRAREIGSMTYIQSDLTAAYNSTFLTTGDNTPKVTDVIREVVFIRPDALVIHDRIQLTDPSTTTIHTVHFNTQPVFENERWSVNGDNASLYIQHLSPSVQYTLNDNFAVAGLSVMTANGESVLNPRTQPRSGRYQLDTFAAPEGNTRWFLSTYLTYLNTTTAPPSPTPALIGDSMRGTLLESGGILWQVMFDDDPQNVTAAQFEVQQDVEFLLLTGLAPQRTYTLNQGDGTIRTLEADSGGLILLSFPPPGVLSLQVE